jgi:predicted amidohydrolase
MICADAWGDDIAGVLALMGAKVILSPCAWAIEPQAAQSNADWIHARYRHLARQHRICIAAANSVGDIPDGPWQDRHRCRRR